MLVMVVLSCMRLVWVIMSVSIHPHMRLVWEYSQSRDVQPKGGTATESTTLTKSGATENATLTKSGAAAKTKNALECNPTAGLAGTLSLATAARPTSTVEGPPETTPSGDACRKRFTSFFQITP